MQTDLWGKVILPKEITVSLYHDERVITNKWLYHSFLFVPVQNEKDVLDLLNEARRRPRSRWEKELHFSNLEKTETENRLALEWFDLFARVLFKKIYFYFFGVNYRNLNKTLWERPQRNFKIYNRFFQIGLYGAIKWFFLSGTARFESLYISNIFSDKKSRTTGDRFHTQPIEEIGIKSQLREENIVFQNCKIIEIDSNHEKEQLYPEKSHLIQFVDIVAGTFSQMFDNTSVQQGKCMVADKCLTFELPAKLMQYNVNSRYYKKYAVSFFPKQKLSEKEILEGDIISKVNQFQNKRGLKYTLRNQLPL